MKVCAHTHTHTHTHMYLTFIFLDKIFIMEIWEHESLQYFCLYYRKKFIKAVAIVVEAFTKAVTQLVDGILADVVRVRSVILESCTKVL